MRLVRFSMRTSTPVYLRHNAQSEPLFNSWYAWSHLIAPASAAMNIANLHLKIMKSYVAAPQIHASAVKNPAMLGGPFIDYEGGRVEQIRGLMEQTIRDQSLMLEFADSVRVLDTMLRNEAKGYSLENLYSKVPEVLRGFVELVYDLNNHPSIRFIESLLYHSRYYNPSLQAFRIRLMNHDDRAFALSTPRLPDSDSLTLNLPFADARVDDFFSMRTCPRPVGEARELMDGDQEPKSLFNSFFAEAVPASPPRYAGDGIRFRYFGHACVLLETRELSILIDPAISYSYDDGIDRFTYSDLPPTIDYILITHGHQDHIMFESLLQLRYKTRAVVVPRSRGGCLEDPSLRLILQNIGFKNIIELGELDTIEIDGGAITGIPFLGEHADLNIGSKIAHLVKLKGQTFLFAADSNNIEPRLYEHLFKLLGDIDVLFLGMECDGAPLSWLYGPLLTLPLDRKMDQSRRLCGSDYEKAIQIVDQFNCREVYVYAMGQEPWLNYVMSIKYTEESRPIVASNRLVEECRRRGITAERLFGQKEIIYKI